VYVRACARLCSCVCMNVCVCVCMISSIPDSFRALFPFFLSLRNCIHECMPVADVRVFLVHQSRLGLYFLAFVRRICI